MTPPRDVFDFQAHDGQITEPLRDQVHLLSNVLGQLIAEQAGMKTVEQVEVLRHLCKRAAYEATPELRDEAEAVIQGLSYDEILWLLRSYIAFFHLVNQAEKQEIIRINQERAHTATPEAPRANK